MRPLSRTTVRPGPDCQLTGISMAVRLYARMKTRNSETTKS
jgi:hypothetical protein